MASVKLLIGRQNALRFRCDEGQRIVERFGVKTARPVGSNGMAAEVEAEPIETVQLPMAPEAARDWIKSVLPEFDIELTSAALGELTEGYVSPWRLSREQWKAITKDALKFAEFERQYMLFFQLRGRERAGDGLSSKELKELSELVGYEVELISWEEALRRRRIENPASRQSDAE